MTNNVDTTALRRLWLLHRATFAAVATLGGVGALVAAAGSADATSAGSAKIVADSRLSTLVGRDRSVRQGTFLVPVCSAADLSLAEMRGPESSQFSDIIYLITNSGTTECSVSGVPQLGVVNAMGVAVQSLTVDQASEAVLETATSSGAVDMTPGGDASFYVEYEQCPDQITPPTLVGEASMDVVLAGVSTPVVLALGQTALSCLEDSIAVSPIQAGVVSSFQGFEDGDADPPPGQLPGPRPVPGDPHG